MSRWADIHQSDVGGQIRVVIRVQRLLANANVTWNSVSMILNVLEHHPERAYEIMRLEI